MKYSSTATGNANSTNDEAHLDDGCKTDTSSDDSKKQPEFQNGCDDTDLEPWEHLIRRAIATDTAKRANMDEWATIHFRRNWRWAGRVAALPCDRWARFAESRQPDIHDRRPATADPRNADTEANGKGGKMIS